MSIIVSYCIRHRSVQGGLGRAFLAQGIYLFLQIAGEVGWLTQRATGIVVFIAMSALNLLSFAMYFRYV